VGVGSKFTLEECRQYATHLQKTGQGITNPGGYATAIHRSGEADALIEKFFQPQTSAEPLDASKCPDCQGTGFWYPQGREQGVSKCKHARLAGKLHPDQSQPSNDKLAPEEITERATLIADLLGSGYTLERARMQFGAGLQPDDWEAIEALATTRLGRNVEG
jgi:hypothetical protein